MDTSKNSVQGNGGKVGVKPRVADPLERDLETLIQEWMVRVEPELAAVPLSFDDRTGHLPNFCAT